MMRRFLLLAVLSIFSFLILIIVLDRVGIIEVLRLMPVERPAPLAGYKETYFEGTKFVGKTAGGETKILVYEGRITKIDLDNSILEITNNDESMVIQWNPGDRIINTYPRDSGVSTPPLELRDLAIGDWISYNPSAGGKTAMILVSKK